MLTDAPAERTRRPLDALVVVFAALLVTACGSDDAGPAPASGPQPAVDPAVAAAPIPGVTGELIVTRQRDLLDRGLINVHFQNDAQLVMEMTDRQLVADHFTTDPAAPRTSKIPNGRPVDLQVPYGSVTDCESGAPVGATLEFTYTTDVDGEPARGAVPLTGTGLLDTIRAEQCAQLTVDAAYDLTVDEPVVDGEELTVDLVVERVADDAPPIEIERSSGTILVDAVLTDSPVSIGDDAVRTPVIFSVIRCDPHAMAEVTKRYGLELTVAMDGGEPRDVDVDVTNLGGQLDTIVANCRERTASES